MNASDPIDVAEAAKSRAISHDKIIREKLSDSKEIAIDESSIEPAPIAQAKSIPHDGDDDEALQKVYPTDEDIRTLRRVADALPWTTFTVAFVELCERFSYYGTTAVCKFERCER